MNHQLRLAILTDGEPFHGGSPEERALGGSETALVQMARALAARGHRVEVYCRCPAPGWYCGVVYHDTSELVKAALEKRWDVLIVSRFFAAFDLPLQAGLKVLWNHDVLDKPEELEQRLPQIDLLLMLSRFHANDYLAKLPQCAAKIRTTVNGLDLDFMDAAAEGTAVEPGRVTYVSRPERGLKLLLSNIWPWLKEQHPHLHLYICGYEVDTAAISPWLQNHYQEIKTLSGFSRDVTLLGPLAKKDYYAHLAACEFLLYPCTFPEISCIAALEAQALGTPIITSDSFALCQTVRPEQFKVRGKPGSPEYVDDFVAKVGHCIQNPQETSRIAAEARREVRREHDWRVIACQWEKLFVDTLSDRCHDQSQAVAASLVINGDRRAAGRLVGRAPAPIKEGAPPPDPKEDLVLREIMAMLKARGLKYSGRAMGVMALDQGRSAEYLASICPDCAIVDLLDEQRHQPVDLLIVRDMLERSQDPTAFLYDAIYHCKPGGWLLLCVAGGAWPLLCPGHANRLFDFDGDDLNEVLANMEHDIRCITQGLVRINGSVYTASRWLALAKVANVSFNPVNEKTRCFRARPAPARMEEEVVGAGLL